MTGNRKDTCGISPKRYPDKNCCVAYVPKGMQGIPGLFPIRGAEGPHRHMVTHKLLDGAIGVYCWGPGRRKETWAIIANGCTKQVTRDEFEKTISGPTLATL